MKPIGFRPLRHCVRAGIMPLVLLALCSQAWAQISFWGNNCCGQDSVPEATGVIALAAGDVFGAALRDNGQVVAWGSSFNGETNIPPGLWDVKAIAAGSAHGLALRAGGTVKAWGSNIAGEGDVPKDLFDVVAIAAGGLSSLALRSDGSVVAWGEPGSPKSRLPPDLENMVAIAVGGSHALALRGEGRVVAWGDNSAGQLNVPPTLTNAVAIAAGLNHSVALTARGDVVAWGGGSETNVPAGLTHVIAISAGEGYSLALLEDGSVRAWGANGSGQTQVPPGTTNAVAIVAAGTFALALHGEGAPAITSPPMPRTGAAGLPTYFTVRASGQLPLRYQWFHNGEALQGQTNSILTLPAVEAEQAGAYDVQVSNALGATFSEPGNLLVAPLLLLKQPAPQTAFWGSTLSFQVQVASAMPVRYQWQFNGRDIPGATDPTLTLNDVRYEGAGVYAVMVSNALGEVRSRDALLQLTQAIAWGDDAWGESQIPATAADLVSVGANGSHGVALQADGQVLVWGDIDLTQYPAPSTPARILAISAGVTHDLAVLQDGTVTGWGSNTSRGLDFPPGLSNVVAVAAGWGYSMALKADGTVALWGGTGAVTNPPPDLSNVVDIAAADTSALALRADGTIVVWGGSRYQTNVPPNLTNAVAIAAGRDNSAAITADGHLVAWGYDPAMTNVPTGISNVVRIDVSSGHVVAVDAAGGISAWGGNSYGELAIPPRLGRIATAAAGNGFTVAMAAAGPPFFGPRLPSRAVPVGMDAAFRCPASGAGPLSYQWQFHGEDLPGATGPVLRLPAVAPSQAGAYTVIARNPLGTATNRVELSVPPFVITTQPRSVMALPGATARFEVHVTSGLPLSFQWLLNGVALPGETRSSLEITNVQAIAAGAYAVEISNAQGTARSAQAMLSTTLVLAWGTNTVGQLNIPANLTNVIGVASGDNHLMALTGDGHVVAWGGNASQQAEVPAALEQVISVAGGSSHTLALRADGTVVAWGDDRYGQSTVPSGLRDVVAIAAGANHSLALQSNGSVIGWGRNTSGQASPPSFLTDVVDIAAGTNGSLALRSDGTLVTWGMFTQRIPFPGGAEDALPTNAVAIAAHGSQQIALLADARVKAWGGNADIAALPAGLSNAVAVSTGTGHLLALRQDGVPFTWGGLAGLPSRPGLLALPSNVATNIAALAGGANHSLALAGAGPPRITRMLPRSSLVPERAGYLFMQATGAQPLSYQWRFNGTNIIGATRPMLAFPRFTTSQAGAYSVMVSNALGVTLSRDTIVGVAPLFLTSAPTNQSVFQGGTVRFQVAATGPSPKTYQWQFNGVDIPGATNATLQWSGVDTSRAGNYTVCVGNVFGSITSRPASLVVNRVAAWGGNGWGQTNVPAGLGEVRSVSLGYTHALALKPNGSVVSWGNVVAPPPVLSQVVQVAAGLSHDVALRADGTVVAWGYNDLGETNVPPGLAGVVEIATAYSVSFAVTGEGRVVAWGDRSDPVYRVPSTATNVATLSVGTGHVLALRLDGTVVAWGSNSAGQVSVPPGLKDVVRVLAAGESSLALRADGTIASWGRLGNDPVVGELGEVVSLASSGDHCLAATRTGDVIAWGDNACGQTNVPPGLRDVIAVFADGCTSLALKSDGRLVAWGGSLTGQAGMAPLMLNVATVSMKGWNVVVLMRDKPPATGLPVHVADWDTSGFGLQFTPPRQALFSVERTDTLTPPEWEHLPLQLGDGNDRLWRDAWSNTSTRFYRVRVW